MYWLVKSEPGEYSWEQFAADGTTTWSGVRNYAARLHLKAMKKGDKVLFYHSGDGKEVQGIATVTKEYYQDPTTDDEAWVAVDLKPLKKLKRTVTLVQIKSEKKLQKMPLITISRLSVMPVKEAEFALIIEMGS